MKNVPSLLRTCRTLGLAAALVAVASVPLPARRQGPPLQSAVGARPYQGVTYLDRLDTTPRAAHLHVIQIDLGVPGIRLKLSAPAGAREVVRQTTLAFLEQEGAQVAINAHYFLPFPSAEPDADVIGIAASEGRVFSAFEAPVQNYALMTRAPGLNIDKENRAGIVHADPADATGRRVREAVTLWTTVAGSAQIVTEGVVTIPRYRDAATPDGQIEPGGPRQYSNANSWYDAVNARTAIGLSRDARTLTLFTVDAAGGSAGMTVGEVAAMLVREFGVWDALNLDGGGSTSLAIVDPATRQARLVTTSADGPSGRAVGSNLAVFAP
jgi:hypothetical protein